MFFQLITTCIKYFPGICGRHQKNLERCILYSVVSKDPKISAASTLSFAWLSSCGSGGEKHAKHVGHWHNCMQKILRTICVTCSDLVNSNISNEDSKTDEMFSLLFPDIDSVSPGLLSLMQIQKLLSLLESVLTKATQYVVQVPLTLIVSTFCEVINLLDVDFEKRSDFLSDVSSLKITLDKLFVTLMSCLTTACKQFTVLLAPFAMVLCRSILNVLSWPQIQTKGNCFKAFASFVEILFISPNNCAMFMDILNIVLDSIKVYANVDQGVVFKDNKPKSRKKNNQVNLFSSDIDRAMNSNKWNGISNKVVCNTKEALICLETIIITAGSVLTSETVKSIIACLLKVYNDVSSNQIGQYTDQNKYQFFKTLSALIGLHHTKVQVPTSILLSIFRCTARNDKSVVSTFCRQVISQYDRVLHTAAPELRVNPKITAVHEETKTFLKQKVCITFKTLLYMGGLFLIVAQIIFYSSKNINLSN